MAINSIARAYPNLSQLIQMHVGRIEFLRFPEKMPTAAKAAEVLRCRESDIAKTCILKTDKGFIAVVLQGTDRINQTALKHLFKHKKCSFATSDDVLKATGYIAGGTPPIGLGSGVFKVFIDDKLFGHEWVFAGGGEQEALIRISPQLIQELSGAERAALSMPSAQDLNNDESADATTKIPEVSHGEKDSH